MAAIESRDTGIYHEYKILNNKVFLNTTVYPKLESV